MNLFNRLMFRGSYLREALNKGGADSLPTNIAWFEPPRNDLIQHLEDLIVLVDLGARGLPPRELDPLSQHLHVVGFDADKASAESSRLRAGNRFGAHEIHNLFVGPKTGKVVFNHYKIPGLSSSYPPLESFRLKYLSGLKIDSVEKVESIRLDEFLGSKGLRPDILKLDVQGSELDILKASPFALSQALMVMVEVEFIEEYEGQGLGHSILEHMWLNGFELANLNRVFLSRENSGVRTRGQLVFGDALFIRPPEMMAASTASRLAKYVLLALNFGHVDLAIEALSINGERVPWADDLSREIGFEMRRNTSASTLISKAFEALSLIGGVLFSDNYSKSNSDRGRPHK